VVINSKNYWVSGLCPSSRILNTRKRVSRTESVSELLFSSFFNSGQSTSFA
jgi:hypothetical protein